MFDDLLKEAYEIPFTSKMRFLTEIQTWGGVPEAPVLNADTAAGLFKVASIVKAAQGDDAAAALELERQAMIDPQVQMALDYEQMRNERDEALEQARQMNQQLFDAQSAQAMSDQQAAQMGEQIGQLEGQIQQEAVARQDAQTQMVAAKDQSLQEQIAVQDQKQQMNMAAQTFQEQANMLTQQLKGIAAQPTAAPAGGAAPPGQEAAQAAAQGAMPPPATAGAAEEQQEAANAAQEAEIQGQQAAQATEEDMAQQQAMQEQQAAAAGVPPEAAMPKQGSAIDAMDRILGIQKTAKDRFSDMSDDQLKSELMKSRLKRGGVLPTPVGILGWYSPQSAHDVRRIKKLRQTRSEGEQAQKTGSAVLDSIYKAAATLDPKMQGAVLGAAIGALGGAASGAAPGMMAGATDTPGQRAGGGMRGFARGALAGAASGAAGGALVGHTMASGQSKEQLGKILGGAGLILGAPIIGSMAGSKGAQRDRGFPKQAMSPAGKIMAPLMGAGIGGGLGALGGGAGAALAAEEGARIEALKRGALAGGLTGAAGGALGGTVAGAGGRPGTGMAILGLSPTAGTLSGVAAGKGARPPRTPEDEELRQLLPEEQMPDAPILKGAAVMNQLAKKLKGVVAEKGVRTGIQSVTGTGEAAKATA